MVEKEVVDMLWSKLDRELNIGDGLVSRMDIGDEVCSGVAVSELDVGADSKLELSEALGVGVEKTVGLGVNRLEVAMDTNVPVWSIEHTGCM